MRNSDRRTDMPSGDKTLTKQPAELQNTQINRNQNMNRSLNGPPAQETEE